MTMHVVCFVLHVSVWVSPSVCPVFSGTLVQTHVEYAGAG